MPKGHYEHKPRVDLTGQKFGDWTVLGRGIPRGPEGRRWLCRCVCGAENEVTKYNLQKGISTGCGCARDRRFAERLVTHNRSKTPEYTIWSAMKQRCLNPNVKKYDLYGGRGITVCERWEASFEAFYADMGPRPDGHSIERIDGDGNYEPGNCHWAPIKAQNRNTARNHFLTYAGETLTIAEWAERTGISYRTLHGRVADGWSVQDALTIPVGRGSARIAHRAALEADSD